MPSPRSGVDWQEVKRPLRAALGKLKAERARLDRYITGIERALAVLAGEPPAKKEGSSLGRAPRRPAMSAKARKVLSQRMKAYWAKRRGATAKEKPKAQA